MSRSRDLTVDIYEFRDFRICQGPICIQYFVDWTDLVREDHDEGHSVRLSNQSSFVVYIDSRRIVVKRMVQCQLNMYLVLARLFRIFRAMCTGYNRRNHRPDINP
jgi:hypothetical protein